MMHQFTLLPADNSLPSLRQRAEDIPLLANHFLQKHARRDETAPELSAGAHAALLAYDWPAMFASWRMP